MVGGEDGFAMTRNVRNALSLGALALMAAAPMAARGQGFLVDRRPTIPIVGSVEIRDVTVDARVRDQVAEVRVSQTFHNPGSFDLESEFFFPLPEDGAIQDFVLMVDGRELPGRLLPKDEARRIFEEIVRSRRDPALMEYMGRGLFRTGVFPIPPHADRKVTLRYQQVLRRDRDVVEFSFPLAHHDRSSGYESSRTPKPSAKPIGRLALDLRIESRDPIKSLYSPNHDATLRRSGDREANVSLDRRDVIPDADFRLVYTVASGPVGASVLSYRPDGREDGYFLLLASPEVRAPDAKPAAKTVVFAIDRSGSMAGKKIEQARRALAFVLDNLRDDDLFNIVAYDDRVEPYKPELVRYSAAARSEAQAFVENLRPGGSTNIDGALKAALGMIADDSRPGYVLFLTDGLPTVGEVNEAAIADHGRQANKGHARLFTFGVGYDVNSRLLDRIAGGNGGTSEYVRPDEDIEAHVSRVYAKLTSPALTDLRVELTGTDLNRTYPRDLPDLFDGGQLVWVGRYRRSGPTTVRLSGKVGGERRSSEFPAELAEPGRGDRFDFVAKVWALRRVGDLIDQIDLHGSNRELIDELVALSTQYGILTPYTSFLADERVSLHASAANAAQAGRNLQELAKAEGESGFGQRAVKQRFRNADKPGDQAQGMGMMPGMSPLAQGEARDRRGEAILGLRGAAPAAKAAAGPAGKDAYAFGERTAAGRSSTLSSAPAPTEARPIQRAEAANVRQVGTKTFFRKDDRWVDSAVTPADEAKAIPLAQFGEDFFKLARSQSAELNQYLTFDDAVTVNLEGKTYRVDRAADPAQDREPK